ncbi:hypothetical protein [Mucilaginibacter sp. CSA2-8R]|uniref:hypothetical protein n=1 Tax=Mucilaginibacter sp. CSA2-8R TaxID=3141542 RepID=UPI00315CD8C6
MTSTTTTDIVYFTVSKVMNVVGIGYIITGHTANGAVKPGAIIWLDNESFFVIDAVEQIEYAENSKVETALILEVIKYDEVKLLFAIHPGQILAIKTLL